MTDTLKLLLNISKWQVQYKNNYLNSYSLWKILLIKINNLFYFSILGDIKRGKINS